LAKRDKKQSIRESIAAISPRVEPDDRETPLNKDFYQNLKAQAWCQLRRRFEKTHRCVSDLTGQTHYDQNELISLPAELPLLRTLQKELSQPTASKGTRMRLVIDKQPEGMRSPNLADAVIMCYWPVGDGVYDSMDWV
jgi:phage terminase large subunit